MPAAGRCRELRNAIRPGFGRVDQCDDLIPRQRRLDLCEAGDSGPCLARQRQSGEGSVSKALVDATGQPRLKLHRTAMSPGEKTPSFGSLNVVGFGRHPNPAARKATTEIGNHRTVGRDDETDQRVDRRNGAGDDADPFWLASTAGHAFLIYAGETWAPSASSASPSDSSAGWRSSSVIQPALMRAAMIIASDSARDSSKPSSAPG